MGKEKKTINVLIDFFISHKSDVKTFFVLMVLILCLISAWRESLMIWVLISGWWWCMVCSGCVWWWWIDRRRWLGLCVRGFLEKREVWRMKEIIKNWDNYSKPPRGLAHLHFAYLWFKTYHFAHLKLVLLAFHNPPLRLPLEKHIFRLKQI